MKKTLFNLQLFADEVATDAVAGSGTDTEKATEQTKEQSTEQKTDGKADEKKYSDEDFNKKLNQKFAEWQKKKEQEIAEAEKLAKMNAEEKANFNAQKEKERADGLQEELDEYKRKDALNEMSKTARKMLADENISIPDELLARLVTTDAVETKAAVDGFAKMFNESVEKAVKEKLRGETPKAGTSGGAAVSEIDKRIKKYEI